jgi:hypothetical protein
MTFLVSIAVKHSEKLIADAAESQKSTSAKSTENRI